MEGGVKESHVIRPINKNVVHRICAGQVILDLSSAVKELVENSLDAGATSIEIALKEYGLESFQVIDNGSGAEASHVQALGFSRPSVTNDLRVSRGGLEFTVCIGGFDCGRGRSMRLLQHISHMIARSSDS
ncbi:UNVERIFIED_CONTAM: DNA mismatch repair protein PMS1 [Sesamum angustifolium]|uniref:DNA mismatch repair protein PMS1 n=1 Tax=Sesamum angustifolium TaxID=2727405 RepID=A0AAW2QUJ6_9LAMI